MSASLRIGRWVLLLGGLGFVLGFFGPMVFAPGANQGPLLGIFITGPAGALLGLGVGLWREWTLPATAGTGAAGIQAVQPLLQPFAAVIGGILLLRGIVGTLAGAGRGAAAEIVIGVVAVYWAWRGSLPRWFRR